MEKAEEVLGVVFPSVDDPAVVLEPGEQALDLPAAFVAAQRPPVPGLASARRQMRRDELDSALLAKPRVEAVAVVGPISNQTVRCMLEEVVVEGLLDEGDFMRRSACNPTGDRKTSAVCNRHDLGPLPTLGLPDPRAPFLAPAKVPSMEHSVMSIPPRS
jgi:hypothetical protein